MNFHMKSIACAFVALVSTLVLVQASRYGSGSPRAYRGSSAIASHYPNKASSYGHASNSNAYNRLPAPSTYGPYHSYAVKPVVYGGHGLYSYKGYARHQAPRQYRPRPAYAPMQNRYPRSHKPMRNYPVTPARHGAQSSRYSAKKHAPAPFSQYSMKPVQAVALVSSRPYQAADQPQRGQSAGYGSSAARNYKAPANHQRQYPRGGGY